VAPAEPALQGNGPQPGERCLTVVRATYDERDIARVVHGVNGLLQEVHGEDHRQPSWEQAGPEAHARVTELVRAFRAGMTPARAHELWCESMRAEGWQWGPVRSERAMLHPNLVPYADLPPRQKIKDQMAQQVVTVMTLGSL
jgi:hypothetical protein